MKRISFLKSLLGIAVAPMAIAKAIEQVDVKPELLSVKSRHPGTRGLMAYINENAPVYKDTFDIPESDLVEEVSWEKHAEEQELCKKLEMSFEDQIRFIDFELSMNEMRGVDVGNEHLKQWRQKLIKEIG